MSTYRLTPNTNATRWGSGSLSAVGTAPASGGQSDGSDSSYLLFAPVPGPFQYTLAAMRVASVAVPSSERVVACRAGGRAWRTTAGTVYANVSAGLPTSGEPRQVGPVGTRALTGSAVDFASGTGAVLLSQADVDSLRVLVSVVASAAGQLARVSESWVELVTASIPRTPVSIAVSSSTVTRPVVSWTHTDRTERTTTTKARTGSTATITTSIAHGFTVGQTVGVSIGDADLDGSWTITAVTSTTFQYTTTTSGTISSTSASGTAWTGDDKAQYQARVKVFSQAQYSASGFDPDAVTPIWTTLVTDGSQSAQVGVDLVNGTTYRAYVRTSATAYGQILTSAFGYVQWTTALATPAAPGTFTATLQPDGSVAVVFNGTLIAPAGSWEPLTQALIERSVDGGSTWQRVWVRPGTADTQTGSGTRPATDGTYGVQMQYPGCDLLDYEAPRGGTVSYRGRQVWTGPSGVLMSNAATASVTVPNDGTYVLRSMLDPTIACRPRVYAGSPPAWEQTETQAVYRPVGRTAAVVVTGDLYAPDAAYTFRCATPAELDALMRVLSMQGRVLLQEPLKDSAGWGRQAYLRAGDKRAWALEPQAHADAPYMTVSVPFTGVDAGVG